MNGAPKVVGWFHVWATRHPRVWLGFMHGPPPVRLHEWGTQGIDWFCVWATRLGREVVRAFARMPTHAVRLHEWGTQGLGWFYVWATRHLCD